MKQINKNVDSANWKLIGVGRNSEAKIQRKIGINTIGDLAHYDKDILIKKFGKWQGDTYESSQWHR